jgi:hypothetical protein
MYSDDFIARKTKSTNDPSLLHADGGQQPIRGLLRTLWNCVRQVAWGIDAYSRVMHGIDVPPDHGARNRPAAAPRQARP